MPHKVTQSRPRKKSARRSPEESRHKFLEAAREQFRRFGFSGTTTAAIARSAGTSEAHLYRHFRTKSDLFREVVFESLNQHFSAFNARHPTDVAAAPHIRQQARQYISELQTFLREHSDLLLLLITAQSFDPGALGGKAEFSSLQAYFERGASLMRKRVKGKPKVDPDLLVRVSLAGVLGCVIFRSWVCPPGTASDDAITEAVIDFVIEGINVNSDPGLLKD
jgi:AcrR family transcriptional regulator